MRVRPSSSSSLLSLIVVVVAVVAVAVTVTVVVGRCIGCCIVDLVGHLSLSRATFVRHTATGSRAPLFAVRAREKNCVRVSVRFCVRTTRSRACRRRRRRRGITRSLSLSLSLSSPRIGSSGERPRLIPRDVGRSARVGDVRPGPRRP